MSSETILVLDQGTHASRAVLYDSVGKMITSAHREVTLRRPAEDRVEQDGAEILDATRQVMGKVLAEAGGLEIRAAGLAVQRSSIIGWDRESGEPLTPVLSWQDTRAADSLTSLEPHAGEIIRRTGLRLSPHYGAGKIAWCLDNLPHLAAARDEGRLVMGPLAGFLVTNLCRGLPHLVDHANASRTQLWHLGDRRWDPWLLERFGVPADVLPATCPILHPFGTLTDCDTPLVAVSGDQNCALFAGGELKPGVARVNLGTGAFVLMPVRGDPIRSGSLLTGIALSDRLGADYLLEGTVNGAGSALTWAGERWPLSDLDEAFTDEGLPVPRFLNSVGGIGSPFWRHDLSPRFDDGNPAESTPRQITRAVAESILFLIKANLDEMAQVGVAVNRLLVSGGLSRSAALCQALADLTRLPLTRESDSEATARGMAWLAAGRPPRWGDTTAGERFIPDHCSELSDRYEAFLAMLEQGG